MNTLSIRLCVIVLCAGGSLLSVRKEIPNVGWTQQSRLDVSGGHADQRLGASVAISADGQTAVVGSHMREDPGQGRSGAAYVFVRSGEGWVQQAQLVSKHGTGEDWFGFSVAISGDGNRIVVGAHTADAPDRHDQGAAYVFTRLSGIWSTGARLFAAGSDAHDHFGRAVAISADGNTIAVGAIFGDHAAVDQGTVSIFVWNGTSWTQQASVTGHDSTSGDFFGVAVSLNAQGDTLVVGAGFDTVDKRPAQGSAYVFARTGRTWTQQAHLLPVALPGQPDLAGEATDVFGFSVALSGNGQTILVGSQQDRVGDSKLQGSAYVFQYTAGGWRLQTRLMAQDGRASDGLGRATALNHDGTTALVGAANGNPEQGAGYVFQLVEGVWTQRAKIQAADRADGDQFGFSAALSRDGTEALLGAVGDDVAGIVDQGSAYHFRLVPESPDDGS